MASLAAQVARLLLILHGLANTAQGLYCVIYPQNYVTATGDMFAGAPGKAVQSIGQLF